MLINKHKTLIALLLIGSILPFKQVMILGGLCVSFVVGRVKRHEILRLLLILGLLVLPLAMSAYRNPINLFASLLLLFPFCYILFFSESLIKTLQKVNLTKSLDFFVHLLILNGAIGLVQYAIYQYDDAAIGFYGRSGLQMHGLAILYFMAALYVISKPFNKINATKSGALLIFMLSCFYGTGLVAAFLAVALSTLLLSKNKIKSSLTLCMILLTLFGLGWLMSPTTMQYNYNILLMFVDGLFNITSTGVADTYGLPRKLTAWVLYLQAITEAPSNIITGFGGGTYNSRAAFLLNGDYSSISLLPVSVTEVHKHYVMPLWSSHILSQAYSDGTMNQPFSSLLALLAEYGLLALILVTTGLMRLRNIILKSSMSSNRTTLLINALFIFFALVCLFDNILEYPEIIMPFIFFSAGMANNMQAEKKPPATVVS